VFGFDFGTKMGAYLIALTLVMVFALAYHRIRGSYYGIALRAMHDSEDATRVVGVNSTLLKAAMLMVSAFIAGVFGAINAHYINFLEPDYAFNALWVTLPIVAAIFGGYRTISGPVIGALVVYLADQLLFKAIMPTGHQLVLGVLLVLMIVFSPSGLMSLLKKRAVPHA
jgi:branched-chain amino acid transport system permease protein